MLHLMSTEKRASTCEPDSNLVFNKKSSRIEKIKIAEPVWRIALSKVVIQPSTYCRETSFVIGKAEDKWFILALIKFKLMVITGAWKYVLSRVFKGLKKC
jgi:hypothetical protein